MNQDNNIFILGFIFCIVGIVLTIYAQDILTTIIGAGVMIIGFLLMILERRRQKQDDKELACDMQ